MKNENKFWFCQECGLIDLKKEMPKNREKFYSKNKLYKCPKCKSEAFMPIGF